MKKPKDTGEADRSPLARIVARRLVRRRHEVAQSGKLVLEIIPHTTQRYDTVGDYFVKDGAWQFRISDMGDRDHELLVFVHELVEWWWAQKHRVANAAIDRFDAEFERQRMRWFPDNDAEPGDHPKCPVYTGHQLASGIERMCAAMLGIDWVEYEAAFDALPNHPSAKP